MPFNGSGVFQRVRNWVADATAGIKIRADYHDAEDDGFAAGLTNCITKDGQTIVTQNIPFNSKRITGLADPINPQDAATKAYADTKVASTGDSTLTGSLTIDAANPTIILDSDVGGSNTIAGKENGKARWSLYLGDDTAEDGDAANAVHTGSNFKLTSHKDDGTLLATPLAIDRATGLATVVGDPTAALGIVTKQYADGAYQAKDAQLFAGIPVNHVGNYTTVLADAQKMLCNTGATPVTMTINGALYPVGSVISFFAYSGYIVVANTETMMWAAPAGPTTGNRTLAQYGVATAHKWTGGNWVIGGNGLT